MDEQKQDDRRVTCNACRHFERRYWRCVNARAAGLHTRLGVTAADIGPELAALPQDCPAYKSKESK